MRISLVIFTVLLLSGGVAGAQTTRPTGLVAPGSCVTADCHAGVKQHKVLHGPVNVNACEACHKPTSVEKHEFELARPKSETCTFCHQVETSNMPVVHKPVADGDCLACHDPHGGATGKFVRGGGRMDKLCNECHQDVIAGKKKAHGPAAAAACGSCHAPHASQFPKLLSAQGKDLCFTCHVEMKDQMASVKFPHKAVEQDCLACHDAHASDFPMQTKQPPLTLCTSCHEHEAVKQAAMDAKHKHSIVTADDACLNCHTAHGGSLDNLMRNDPVKVCMKCHDKPIQVAEGKTVPAVSEVLDSSLEKHGPIKDGSCGGCHNVHGSDIAHLLTKNYPPAFYQPFSLDKYDLCFSCHDKQLVLAAKTTGLTNFRNGEQNLHFLHVNKSDRGRNCRACHNAHASPNPLHVRSTVPYGNWEMPINFKQTQTGGSCLPGCHKEFAYDRDSPASYKPAATSPTTQEIKQ